MARFRQSFPAISAMYLQRSADWLKTLFFLILGISMGVFTELFLPEEDKSRVALHLLEHLFPDGLQIDHSAVFFQSAGSHLGLLAVIFLSGLTSFGVPATYAALAYKGAALGFSAAILLDSLALRGVLTTVLAIVPSHLLILPALILASSAAINYVSSRRPGNRRKRSLSSIEPGPYCLAFLFPLILILIAAVLEAFISPAFLQLIRSQ